MRRRDGISLGIVAPPPTKQTDIESESGSGVGLYLYFMVPHSLLWER